MGGMVAAGDIQTAQAGAEMLRLGGNACDAVVSAAFTACVAEAVLVNISAGGTAIVCSAHGTAENFDFFSAAPSGTLTPTSDFREVVLDFGATQQSFFIGHASVAVPGLVAGLCQLAERKGCLPLPALLQPAIRLARAGAVISPAHQDILTMLAPIFSATPECQRMMTLQDGRLFLPELAHTLEQLSQQGAGLFSHGQIAQAIAEVQAQHGGLVTATDLQTYSVWQQPPLRIEFYGYEVLLPPPSSTGGVLVGYALQLLQAVDWQKVRWGSLEHLQAVIEATRLTNLARQQWEYNPPLASVAQGQTQAQQFLSSPQAQAHRAQFQAILAGGEAPYDAPLGRSPEHTTHISAVDADGNMAAVTFSAGANSGVVVGNTGVSLNNILGEADLHPHGFHRSPAGTRLQTMMTPTVVLKQGRPILALGSGGSNRIRSAVLQTLLNVVAFAMPLAQAVSAPRLHFENDVVQIEPGYAHSTLRALSRHGYTVNLWERQNMFFGGAHAVAWQQGGALAAGDARRGGAVSTA
ncbi:MAG TPA: gamma-glutamyltransferase [Anaerolineales bacterium]|nr:gamma-glutamyltransferase [Anaerolineales bacterium]